MPREFTHLENRTYTQNRQYITNIPVDCYYSSRNESFLAGYRCTIFYIILLVEIKTILRNVSRCLQKSSSKCVWEIAHSPRPGGPQSTQPHLFTRSVFVHNLQTDIIINLFQQGTQLWKGLLIFPILLSGSISFTFEIGFKCNTDVTGHLCDFGELLCQCVQETSFQEVLYFFDSPIHVVTEIKHKKTKTLWGDRALLSRQALNLSFTTWMKFWSGSPIHPSILTSVQ